MRNSLGGFDRVGTIGREWLGPFGGNVWFRRVLAVILVAYACASVPAPIAEIPLNSYVGRLVTIDVVVVGDTLPFCLIPVVAKRSSPPRSRRWRVVEMIYDGALSEEFLRAWVITLDLAEGKAWAVRAASREAA